MLRGTQAMSRFHIPLAVASATQRKQKPWKVWCMAAPSAWRGHGVSSNNGRNRWRRWRRGWTPRKPLICLFSAERLAAVVCCRLLRPVPLHLPTRWLRQAYGLNCPILFPFLCCTVRTASEAASQWARHVRTAKFLGLKDHEWRHAVNMHCVRSARFPLHITFQPFTSPARQRTQLPGQRRQRSTLHNRPGFAKRSERASLRFTGANGHELCPECGGHRDGDGGSVEKTSVDSFPRQLLK